MSLRRRLARKVRGVTPKALAAAVGCSESMLSKIETGKTSPSLPMLHRLAEALEGARAEAVPERRAALYHQAEAQVRVDDPMLFLTFPTTIQASSASLDWQQYPDGALELQFAHMR